MQDRYVGDVGDFAKYALLKGLVGPSNLSLGVVWCLYPNESHNSDGRHIGYLQRPEFRNLDVDLHDGLATIVRSGRRSVAAISKAKLLPSSTTFFDFPSARPDGHQLNRAAREAHRATWLTRALAATRACDVVFFDPDNGIEVSSVKMYAQKAGKYVFWNELSPFWDRGQSLIIYHHLNRTASVARQTEILQEKFAVKFADAGLVRYFLFRRGSCRHFWLIAQKEHALHCQSVIDQITQSEWREYFEVG
jgi:hypothetical protein